MFKLSDIFGNSKKRRKKRSSGIVKMISGSGFIVSKGTRRGYKKRRKKGIMG